MVGKMLLVPRKITDRIIKKKFRLIIVLKTYGFIFKNALTYKLLYSEFIERILHKL